MINPFKLIAAYSDLNRAQKLLKEGPMTPQKITQIAALIAQVLGSFGVAASFQTQMGTHGWIAYAAASINGLITIWHVISPAITEVPTNKVGIILMILGLSVGVSAQTPPPTDVQNIFAGGVSWNVGASPAVAGTGLYAHSINTSGTYAFTVLDALPSTVKPFTVSTNIGVGVAQKIATLGKVPIYVPTTAGISWSGSNTGWQWSGGGLASIRLKGDYYLMPSLRFMKSSVSSNSGYQLIPGVLFAWGK